MFSNSLLCRTRALPVRRLALQAPTVRDAMAQGCRHMSWLRGFSSTPVEEGKPAVEEPTAAGDAAEREDVAALKAKLAETEEKLKQRHDQLLRAVADADNIRKRTAVEVDNAHKYSIGGFAKTLLEVADNLERALELVPESVRSGAENPPLRALYEGVKLTDEQLVKSFASVGLVRVNPLGEKFDPNLHEALFEMPDPTKEAGMVGNVMSVGYKLHDRCLRSAKVGVVKNKK
mmetsp:Transcript_9092/g.23108  ORF Transcript_9092/g.23108 Transcript_9092/m.23108 type:complete len:232 (-) Transcript_9092:211-906(-)